MIFLIPLTLLLSLLLSIAIRRLSLRTGVVDLPDFRRKLHTLPVPRLGGVAFFLAFYSALIAKGCLFGSFSELDSALISAGGLSLLFGAIDDFFDLLPLRKLCLQLVSASSAALLLPEIYPIRLSIPFIVLMMNAYNFIDGLDALAASLSLSSLLFISLSSLMFFNTGMGITPVLLLFSLLGFLPLNLHPASLYMGESGSATLGLSIAVITLSLPLPAALLSLSFSLIPIFDAVAAVPRRILLGRSPFSADKGHIHHRLLSLGVAQPTATAVLALLSLLLSFTSLSLAVFLS